MIKIYADKNIDIKRIREIINSNQINENKIEIFQWPIENKNRRIKNYGLPAGEIRWEDNNMTWEKSDFAWNEFKSTAHYKRIQDIIGKEHRCDCTHLDIAIKNSCSLFLTSDNDILSKKTLL